MNTEKRVLTDAERKAILERTIELMQSGFGGLDKKGEIVDRRETPDAVPFQENRLLNTPKPKEVYFDLKEFDLPLITPKLIDDLIQ